MGNKALTENSYITAGIASMIAIAAFFYFYQLNIKTCCDAENYLELAKLFETHEAVDVSSSLRTYGYPWFLSILISLSNTINIPSIFLIFAAQTFIYLCSVFYVRKIITIISEDLANYVFFALSLNIFLLPYFSVTLTDGLYTVLCLVALAAITHASISIENQTNHHIKLIILLFLLIGVTLSIRPAAIWLTIPILYFLIKLLFLRKINIGIILLGLAIAMTPLFIQMTVNFINFKILSFFPVEDLGNSQIKWGIENIKYGTWLGGGPAQNFYSSENLITWPKSDGEYKIAWYFLNPAEALKLLSVKLIGAFDFDFLIPYPYEKNQNSWIPSLLSFAILWFGIFGSILHATTNSIASLGDRFLPVIIFIAWASINLISALELRFTLPILTYLIIVAVSTLYNLIQIKNRKMLVFSTFGFLIFLPIVATTSIYIRQQSVIF